MLKESVLPKNTGLQKIMPLIAAALVSALTAHSSLCGMPSALGCALAAVFSPVCSAAVFSGCVITCFLEGTLAAHTSIICSLLLIAAGRWFVRGDNSPLLCAGITVLSMSFSGVIFGLLIEESTLSALKYILTGLVTGLCVYFLHNAKSILLSDRPIKLDSHSLISLSAVWIMLCASLCSVGVTALNLGRIIGSAAVLWGARRFGSTGGAVMGVITSLGIFICSAKLGLPAVFLGTAGFAAGFALSQSRVSSAAAFLAVNFLGQLITGLDDAAFFFQADAVLGCIIYMVIPERILMYGLVLSDSGDDGGGLLMKIRMEFAAMTLGDVRRGMEDIIKRLDKNTVPFNTVNEVSERVCSKCRHKVRCWDNNYEKTNSSFLKLEKNLGIPGESFPAALEHCPRKYEIAENFARCHKEDAVNKMLSARLNESRSILFSQMEATEGILSSLSDKMNFTCSKGMTEALCRILEKYDIEYTSAIAYFCRQDRLVAELYVREMPEESIQRLTEILSGELRTPMNAAEPVSCGSEIRLRFSRKPKYTAVFAAEQKSACESQPSGDSWGFFEDGLGYAYIFISDGMGSGKQAAIDSAIVSRLFRRLIKSGIDCGCAVKLLNGIMLTKSGEESFATLDIARIDLETCELTLFKSGASSTLIKYDDSVMMFNSPSNPIGIIPDSQIFSRGCSFEEGNVLVMLSDGVDESLYLYIKEQLLAGGELKEFAENVCMSAEKKSRASLKDDITVAALKLVKS